MKLEKGKIVCYNAKGCWFGIFMVVQKSLKINTSWYYELRCIDDNVYRGWIHEGRLKWPSE
jgi:hypothetical protein